MAGRGRAGPAAFSTSRSRTRVGGAQRCFLHAGIKAGRKFLDGWSFDATSTPTEAAHRHRARRAERRGVDPAAVVPGVARGYH